MSAQIIHPPSTETLPFAEPTPSSSLASLPTVALTPGFFSLPSLANETWSPSNALPTPPPLPSWAIKPDPDQPSLPLCIDPALQSPQTNTPHNNRTPSSKNTTTEHLLHTTLQTKREHFLARNRLAASKCRQKKKKHNKELESQYEQVYRRKKTLQTEAEYLRSQVLQLKDELLRHSQCDDVSIRGHLAQMVHQVTKRSSGFMGGGGLLTASATTADSPLLLQEVLEKERRGSEGWSMGSEMSGEAERKGDDFEDLINFG